MQMYSIAGLVIRIDCDDTFVPESFNTFKTCPQQNENLNIKVIASDCIENDGDLLFNGEVKWLSKSSNSRIKSICLNNHDNEAIRYIFEVDDNWNYANITYLKDCIDKKYILTGPLGQMLFFYSIIFNQGIILHAAAIEWEGKGIIFSAPSGTGKTTQANLWKTIMGAKILNGDRPAVRVLEGHTYVYGTPWSGSSPEFLNRRAPLEAIIMLEQDSQNSIQRLSNQETIAFLLPRSFLPYLDKDLMNLAIQTLQSIIASTPVYLLKCKPDSEAVELVYQCVR